MREFQKDWLQLISRYCVSNNTKCQHCKRDMKYGEPKHDIRLFNGEWCNGFWEYNICHRCIVNRCKNMRDLFEECCQIIEATGHDTAETLAVDLQGEQR